MCTYFYILIPSVGPEVFFLLKHQKSYHLIFKYTLRDKIYRISI